MKRILIVEDDVSIADIEKDYLEINGYQAEIETDGSRGLKRAQDEKYDLILLDLMLPGMGGFEICRTLRQTLNIPILMVTAKKEDIDKIRGLGLGADDYIVKPFSPGELVARVGAHLNRYDRLTSAGSVDNAFTEEIAVGSIKIHPKSRRVYVRGEETEFTNKEYELLIFLVTNADIVFSKETLYEQIWGMDAFGDIATVTVHIGRLREKIENEPTKPVHIQTVWGAGYRFKG